MDKLPDVKPVYSYIVDSVIANARAHFLQDGVDESILEELKVRWEAKLEGSDIFNSAEGEVEEAKEEGEGAGNTGEGDEDAGEGEAGKRASGDGSEGAPAQKKQKVANDPAATKPNGGASTSAAGEKQADTEKDKDGLDSDLEDDEAEDDVKNMVLAQYDKVVRNKNKWKCTMKNGIVHIDGREYVFSKATGEFVF
eukprot:jgi/Ulvmu1/2018/UM120_0014.1